MKALTLHRPWAGLIAAGIKAVENRTWPPPNSLFGQRLAIHAGKKWDADGAQWAFEVLVRNGVSAAEALVATGGKAARVEGVVAVVTVAGWVHEDGRYEVAGPHNLPFPGTSSPWFVGPYGWVLADVVTLARPVPCRGAQGLWTVPPDVEAAVLSQMKEVSNAR